MKKRGKFTTLFIINKRKGYLQMSFGWIFAIVAGVFILFLAIFLVTNLTDTEETFQSAKTGKEIGILLNPLETNIQTGTGTSFNLPIETRIYSECENWGNFGRQLIKISQKNLGKWKETDLSVKFPNKYIFSEIPEGKNFYIFLKPFIFPFKVSDLIYLSSSSEEYCFIDAPENIKEEIENIKQKNLLLEENCTGKEIKVCFEGGNCDINVDYNSKFIEKKGKRIYFEEDALMYAGIFSSPELYECQLKRLMQRIKYLSQIYRDKERFISTRGCSSNLGGDLSQLIDLINDFEDSSDLKEIKEIVEDIKNKNDNSGKCKLW